MPGTQYVLAKYSWLCGLHWITVYHKIRELDSSLSDTYEMLSTSQLSMGLHVLSSGEWSFVSRKESALKCKLRKYLCSGGKSGAGKTAKSVKFWPCGHDALSVIPREHQQENEVKLQQEKCQVWQDMLVCEDGGEPNPGVCWPANPACLASSRPVRNLV